MRRRPHRHPGRGFTLTELLIAVAVLVVVLLAIGRIFSTTTQVTGVSKATNDVLQEAVAIERLLRDDFREMTPDGVLAIRCVAVPNNINGAALLNPALAPDAVIRCDQIVFFTNNVQTPQMTRSGSGVAQIGQSLVARMYYGHAFQLGEAGLGVDTAGAFVRTHDPMALVFPWTNGAATQSTVPMARTQFGYSNPDNTDMFSFTNAGNVTVPGADARRWLFVRQPIMLADDDTYPMNTNHKTVYLGATTTARSVFQFVPGPAALGGGTHPQVLHGRVEAAATELDDVRRIITTDLASGDAREWATGADSQRSIISADLLYYPRAERTAPSMHRLDRTLTSSVLSSACSSVRIDWTYDHGTWFAFDRPDLLRDVDRPHPWFGMPDPALYANAGDAETDRRRGVGMFGDPDHADLTGYVLSNQIDPDLIESIRVDGGAVVYEAIFGYNRDDPFSGNDDFTPWPSAIRITLTLHDPETTLEAGRDVQFVLKLPSLVQ